MKVIPEWCRVQAKFDIYIFISVATLAKFKKKSYNEGSEWLKLQ